MPVLQGRGRGDHRVLVNVAVPAHLTDEQRELLERVRAERARAQLRDGGRLLRQAARRVPLSGPAPPRGPRPGRARARRRGPAMLALFPEGFEEREADGALELAAYTDGRTRPTLLGELGPVRELEPSRRAGRTPGGASTGRFASGRSGSGRPGSPRAGRDPRRHRPGSRVRHRRSRDDSALPRAAARRGADEPPRRRLRVRRDRGRGGQARLRAGRRARQRRGGGRGHSAKRSGERRRARRPALRTSLTDALPAVARRRREPRP